MADEGLPPGVQNAEEADPGAEVSGGGRHVEEGVGACPKQQLIDHRGIASAEDMERMGQGEDHVDVRHREDLTLPRGEPPRAGLGLALRAVPVATRVVGDRAMPTRVTLIDVPAQRGGPAASERSEHRPVLDA